MKVQILKSDLLGISASGLCLVHCLVTPFLLSGEYLLRYFGMETHHHFDFVFMFMALLAVWISARNSSNFYLKIGFWVAFSVFTISILLHDILPIMFYLSMLASLILIILHILNWKYHIKCKAMDE